MSCCRASLFIAVVCAVIRISDSFSRLNILRPSTALNCVGKILQPLPKSDDETYRADGGKHVDTDYSWKTKASTIIPVNRQKFSTRPQLITFEPCNTLIEPSQSIGRWYREALNNACDMAIRLPRPILFTNSFNIAYADMSKAHPCFGSVGGEMTSEQWWMEVVRRTFLGTENLSNILSPKEIETVLPKAFNTLYNKVCVMSIFINKNHCDCYHYCDHYHCVGLHACL